MYCTVHRRRARLLHQDGVKGRVEGLLHNRRRGLSSSSSSGKRNVALVSPRRATDKIVLSLTPEGGADRLRFNQSEKTTYRSPVCYLWYGFLWCYAFPVDSERPPPNPGGTRPLLAPLSPSSVDPSAHLGLGSSSLCPAAHGPFCASSPRSE